MNTNNPRTCEYCGRALPVRKIPMLGGRGDFEITMSCDCERAKAEEERIERERKAEEERRQREATERRYRMAGIPRRYWNAETDDPRMDGWLETIEQGYGLYFTGKQGRGKTHAACAILRKFIDRGWRVIFADVEAIEREVTSAWRSRETSEEAVISRYLNAQLVVIDDLGAEALTQVTMKALRAVISGREANGQPVIFTSNYSRLEFANHIAEKADKTMAARLASRIKGMTEVAEFDGADRRLERTR